MGGSQSRSRKSTDSERWKRVAEIKFYTGYIENNNCEASSVVVKFDGVDMRYFIDEVTRRCVENVQKLGHTRGEFAFFFREKYVSGRFMNQVSEEDLALLNDTLPKHIVVTIFNGYQERLTAENKEDIRKWFEMTKKYLSKDNRSFELLIDD